MNAPPDHQTEKKHVYVIDSHIIILSSIHYHICLVDIVSSTIGTESNRPNTTLAYYIPINAVRFLCVYTSTASNCMKLAERGLESRVKTWISILILPQAAWD